MEADPSGARRDEIGAIPNTLGIRRGLIDKLLIIPSRFLERTFKAPHIFQDLFRFPVLGTLQISVSQIVQRMRVVHRNFCAGRVFQGSGGGSLVHLDRFLPQAELMAWPQ
ncbi:MAG TPA: hypothetical protein VK852_11250 [Desulfobacterales bacterium]|nr:hypothetical protein [Desulfobacterales bacterium]